MINFFRKIFLVDFVLSMFQSNQNPHVRFAKFLSVFAYLWLILAVLLVSSSFDSQGYGKGEWTMLIFWVTMSLLFFFLYNHTSKILKQYTETDTAQFGFLRFLNPLIPVIYATTIIAVVVAVVNMVMFIIMIIGILIFIIGVVVSLGFALLNDQYRMKNFISLPKTFYDSEMYVMDHIVSPVVIISFLIFIYFVIPIGASTLIIWQHYSRRIKE